MSEQQSSESVQAPPSTPMFQYMISLMIPQAIHIAAKLGIADMVAKAPASVEELIGYPSIERTIWLETWVLQTWMCRENITRPRSGYIAHGWCECTELEFKDQ